MKAWREKALLNKYPKIFPPGEFLIQIETGDGWYKIIDDLCGELQALSDKTGHQVVAFQVKEKFGSLRFYASPSSIEIMDIISGAEHLSENTCEDCGEPGEIRDGSWLRTLCEAHK